MKCPQCRGYGHPKNNQELDCSMCEGQGVVHYNLLLNSMKLIVENLDHITDNPNNEALLNIDHLARAAMKKVNTCR